jgi:iron(III) transport system substrate-binding protein
VQASPSLLGDLYGQWTMALPFLTVRRVLAPLLAVVAVATAVTGCGDDDRLTVYSGRTENLVGPLLERFSDETGTPVAVRYADSAELALLIEQEGDRSPADVYLSQSPGGLSLLAGDGRLAPLPDGVLDAVADEHRSDEGVWVGLSGRVRTLVYNTDRVDPDDLPETVFDLVAPEFEGRVGLAPTNGSFQDFVTAMRVAEGDERTLDWLTGMADNDCEVFADNTAIVQAVARGEVDLGLVNHYYREVQQQEDPGAPTENHVFARGDVGSLLLVTGAGVVEGTDHGEDAERLVEFLLSEESQRFFSEETFEYPLAAGVPAPEGLTPLDELGARTVDFDELGGALDRTQELLERSGLQGR